MSPSLALSLPPLRILIVDDELDNRELLQIVLRWEGFETSTAGSGEDALAQVAAHAPDLVLLDLMMPGLDGCEVTLQLKANLATRHIPVLIISAMDDRDTRIRVLGAGAVDFIAKPIDRFDLCQRVRSVLGLQALPAA